MDSLLDGRIIAVLDKEIPIYMRHIPALGIKKDCVIQMQVKIAARREMYLKLSGNLDFLLQYEKKHNFTVNGSTDTATSSE